MQLDLNENESFHENEGDEDSIFSKKESVDESMTWSLVPPDLDDDEEEEKQVEDDLNTGTLLNSASGGKNTEAYLTIGEGEKLEEDNASQPKEISTVETHATKNNDIIEKESNTGGVELSLCKIKDTLKSNCIYAGEFVKKVSLFKMSILWFVTLVFAFHLARLSSEQSQLLRDLKGEINFLKDTISELEKSKVEQQTNWMTQGSEFVKEWASTIVDADTNELFTASDNESSYLDIWPTEAYGAMKNVSSNIVDIVSEHVSSTKDAFVAVSEKLPPVDAIKDTLVHSASKIFDDVFHSQKYAVVLAAVSYKIYEAYFQDDGV